MEERRKLCRLTAAALLVALLVARSASGRQYCNQHQCGGDDLCIPLAYVCDDEQDCADYSDELGCDPKLCQGADEFHCFDGHHCIPLRWTCDGTMDCKDGSDEHTCPNITCDADHVSCGVKLPCVHSSFLCDGHVDCPGGYDERNSTCASKPCDEDEFRCATGHQCISQRWICDGDSDCHDGSDERNCPPVTCPPTQYHCPRSGECIPSAWLCDESYDCEDRSDEEVGCAWTATKAPLCPADELACTHSGECLHASWRCDGDKDCADGTDELNCPALTCDERTQFQCRTAGNCISAAWRCDGNRQCDDGSDEADCFNARCDPVTEFDCSAASGQPISSRASRNCIPIGQVCDGRNSCGNNEDEAEAICANRTNPCLVNKGGCEHVCLQGLRAAFCRCHEGYELREDGKSCADIDECSAEVLTGNAGVEPSRGRCSQLCDNTRGGYKCRCKLGYDLDPINRATCYARGSEPFLLFASRHDVREFRVRSQHYRPLVEGLRGARALALAGLQGIGARRTLFWSDVANITRVVLSLNASSGSSPSSPAHDVIVSGVKAADGLAYDWIHDNLYWTDGSRGRIEVMSGAALTQISANGRWRKTVLDKLDEPKAIVLDPRDNKRYMYWTECGRTPQILRASLDGSAMEVVVATSTNVILPLGLTIDYETDSLLWVDAKLHSIFSVDLETRRSHVIFVSHIYLRHPFALSVFEDTVYWADTNTNSIYKRSKFHTTAVASAAGAALNNVTKVAQLLAPPTDLHVYHALRQPYGPNACADKSCSHLCLPRAAFPGFVCACPDPASDLLGAPRLTLDARGRTCVPSTSDLRPLSSSPALPPMRGAETSLPSTAAPLNALAGGAGTTDGVQGGAPVFRIAIGVVAFVVVIVVVLVLLSLAVRRRYQRRNRKTMNFDNPLYRKRAGDDQFSLQNNMRPADNRISAHPLTEPLNLQTNECFVTVESKE